MHRLKHYVEKFYQGVIVSESSVEEIKERLPSQVNPLGTCYGFRFFDKSILIVDDETLTGERKNVSGMYYPGGKIYTLDDVKKHYPTMRTLISNMECNSIKCVVQTIVGNWQQFYKDDNLI